MQLRAGFLAHRGWIRTAVVISALALVAYLVHSPPGGREGSTWVGYGLGAVSGLLVLWLSWLGVMKRRFASTPDPRRDTVSAHVYLGLSLIVLATLHTGFEFEWSIHTLTYVLLMLVIASGLFGVSTYAVLPEAMSDNLGSMIIEKKRFDISNREQLEIDIDEVDRRLERALQFLPDAFRDPVKLSLDKTRLGGGLFRILSGSSRHCATARALREVREMVAEREFRSAERQRIADLIRDLARKEQLAACLRRDGRYRALLSIWLWVHVPLTLALIVTLFAHVGLVFFYW